MLSSEYHNYALMLEYLLVVAWFTNTIVVAGIMYGTVVARFKKATATTRFTKNYGVGSLHRTV